MRKALILSAALLLGLAFAPAAPSAAPSSLGLTQTDGADLSAQRKAKKKKVMKRKKARKAAKRSMRSSPGEATKRSGTQGREPGTGSPPVNRN